MFFDISKNAASLIGAHLEKGFLIANKFNFGMIMFPKLAEIYNSDWIHLLMTAIKRAIVDNKLC